MLKRELKVAVLMLSGLLVLSSSLLLASPQDSQKPDDSQITTAIQAKLFQSPSLKTQDIHVSTQNGIVTLTGTVDSETQQAAVDRIASMQPGVVKVVDSLYVSPPPENSSVGNAPSSNGQYSQPSSSDAQPADPGYSQPTPSQQSNAPQPFNNGGTQDATVPDTLHMPAGTMVSVRTNQELSSNHSQAGDVFNATLEQPVVVNGWVVARRGQTVQGEVLSVNKGGRVKGVSRLEVALTELTLVSGQQLPVRTRLIDASAGPSKGRDAAGVATTTGIGAMIGAIAGDGEGAGIGAGIGAAVGVAGVLLTRGRPTVIPPEALLTFRVENSAEISTLSARAAFRPVTQEDYAQTRLQHRQRLYYPPRPYYGPQAYYGYYGWPGYAAYPYWGWGSGWGYWGPGFYGVYRFRGDRDEWREDRGWRGERFRGDRGERFRGGRGERFHADRGGRGRH